MSFSNHPADLARTGSRPVSAVDHLVDALAGPGVTALDGSREAQPGLLRPRLSPKKLTERAPGELRVDDRLYGSIR